jgi:RNA polymerase sigma-70 factor (ECF subfamily)
MSGKSPQPVLADDPGRFDDRYRAFLEAVAHLRERLHKYCAHLTGSTLDGEDVMQEALIEAYRKLDMLDKADALAAWIFRIAHNRAIDLIRRRRPPAGPDLLLAPETVEQKVHDEAGVRRAIERLVLYLPAMERACVLLKDVFDYELTEIAELVGSTVGGVKSALNRGRAKLADVPPGEIRRRAVRDPARLRLLQLYVERFNRQDWDGVRALTAQDARVKVSDCFRGKLANSPYFTEYAVNRPWHARLAEYEGELVVLITQEGGEGPHALSVVRIENDADRILTISDYYACPWVLKAAFAGTA